jgi:hypothetical protein
MKNSHKQLSVPLLAAVCLFAGCALPAGRDNTQQTRVSSAGIPVRVSTQDAGGLPVELQIDKNKSLPVEARLQVDDKIPVELVVAENTRLPVDANIQADNVLSVKIVPSRALWIVIAIAGLIALFTMVSCLASCRAAINARRAAERQVK